MYTSYIHTKTTNKNKNTKTRKMPSPTAKLINDLRSCQYDQPDRHRLMGVKSFSDWYFRVARRDMIQWRMRQLKQKYGSIVKYYEGNYRKYSFIHFH